MLTNPTYQQAKDAIFATATIPDGYNGHTTDVGFALAVLDWAPDEMSILAVWDHGWFRFLSKPRTETSEGWAMDALAQDRRVSNLRLAPAAIGAPLGTLTPVIGKRA
jgi:hypothetical protein